MRVLVTGANGFLGSSLCPYLAELGHDVVPVVRRPSNLSNEHIISDASAWMTALKGCVSVIHLAARANVMHDQAINSLSAYRSNNVKPTLELATRAVEAGIRRFVFMSTVKVNGEETSLGRSFRPEDPVDPKDQYSISKWEAELGLFEIAKRTGLEVVIIRPPLVYGPGVKGNFATLIKWIKTGVPLPFGALRNRRSMIGLDNLLSFTALCAYIDRSPNAKDQVFLVSDGEDVSTAELLRLVAIAYGCKSRMFRVPVNLMHLAARCTGKSSLADRLFGSLVVDDSKARQMLGWYPPFNMEDQLQKLALYDSRV